MLKKYKFHHKVIGNLSKYYKRTMSRSELEHFLYNPYPFYSKMRKFAPVFWSEEFKHWLVFDYDGVSEVLVNNDVFSSESIETFNLVAENRDLISPFFDIMKEWLVLKDDPRHADMRQVIAKVFTPKYLLSKEQQIKKIAEEKAEVILSRKEFDFHNDFSVPFSSEVFMNLLGVNSKDLHIVEPMIKDLALVVGRTRNIDFLKKGIQGIKNLEEYLTSVIIDRKQNPQNDILTLLVQANDRGVLTESELTAQAIMLLSGGFETISATLSGGVQCLLKNKRELNKLHSNRNLVNNMIEETLRFVAPAQAPTRIAAKDINFRGIKIKKGEGVAPVVASANRDEQKFKNPDVFLIDRKEKSHLAMGKGVHHCIGASLSRMELKIAIEVLLDSGILNNIQLKSEKEDWNTDNFSFRLPKTVMVEQKEIKCPFTMTI